MKPFCCRQRVLARLRLAACSRPILQNRARLLRATLATSQKPSQPAAGQYSRIKPACGGPHLASYTHLTALTNRARLRRAYTPKSSPPAAGHRHLTRLRNRARLRRAHTPNTSPPAAGGPHLTPLTKQALKTVFCLKTAIFEMFHSISHQPGRVRGSHLVRLV